MDLTLLSNCTGIHFTRPHDVHPFRLSLPSPRAYTAIIRGYIPHSFDDPSEFDKLCFPVIINSGASLEISSSKSDIVGEIKKVDLRLGGMANDMPIEIKREVEWISSTGGVENVTIRTLCYYVPDYRAWLLNPQCLFTNAKESMGSASLKKIILAWHWWNFTYHNWLRL